MNSGANTRTSLFLMEIIISVLFLSLSGAVCVQMFVKAHLTGKRSVDANNAVIWTQNISESFYSVSGDTDRLFDLYSTLCVRVSPDEAEASDGTLILFMDSDWNAVEYPASDLSGVSASYEVLVRIQSMPAYELYSDTGISAEDKALLEESGITAKVAEIAVMDVDNKELIDSCLTIPVPEKAA